MTGLVSVRELMVRLIDGGYQPYVTIEYDRQGYEYPCLFMWKMADGVFDRIKIGGYGEERMRLLRELGMDLKMPLADGVLVGPPVAPPEPTNPLTLSPKGQAPPPKGSAAPEDKNLDRLRNDFAYYKTNDYLFMLRKKKDIFHLTASRRGDPEGKEINLGRYDGPIEKICEELDIDIADIRRLKAKGWNFRRSVAKGSLTARGTDETGERREFYIGVYEGPLVKLCKKYGIVIESE
jgi:hypothetical protein